MAASLLRREAGFWGQYMLRFERGKNVARGQQRLVCHVQLLVRQKYSGQSVRSLATSLTKSEKTDVVEPSYALSDQEALYRERYIPITRRSVIRHLMQEEDFLTDEEKRKFDDFALALDSAIVNKYHGVLQELKRIFDPLNPDKDTIATREWTRRERLDNEFWLLQQMEDIMEKANFHELSSSTVSRALEEHEAREGVRVSVDPNRYDVLRFWALGRERPLHGPSIWERLVSKVTRTPIPQPMEYYKRVVLAIRLKKDSKLMLKAFKEVPINSLEMLLPDGTIKMSTFDKGLLSSSVFLASVGVVAKVVTVLAEMKIDWTLIVTAITGMVGIRAWTVYKNRRNSYLVDVSRMLYFKNIANNRGLLTLLVDRAEDESFKEALLTYTFLLTNRPPSEKAKPSSQHNPAELGGITAVQIEKMAEDFISKKTGVKIEFDSSEAVKLLKGFGLLSEKGDKLNVLSLDAAMRNLPQQPQSVVARGEEADITEGYDRDEYLETEEEYKDEERKTKKYGWF
ncbi:transmembrane protein 143-like [Haliotis asinina]|uniref:transmembrane protein 143-like n=1 Tax=Haliotis asinina TaxID=109174 RepID=UPI003531FA72